MDEPRCAKCHSPITPGARFCMTCGADVSGEQSQAATLAAGATVFVDSRPRASTRSGLEQLREATLGDYEILAELGRGGMATVFLAHDIQLDRKVAIKVLHPQLLDGPGMDGMVDRFKLEARTAAGLQHPNIIPIYAVRDAGHLLYFVMKFVAGRPLDSIIKQAAPLSVPMVRTILGGVADALAYAHRNGVVHRDVKPANIMIDKDGTPVVMDFGIAKVSDKQGLTMTGATVGTPTYMSPEQCNARPITGASDQYSLGVMAFEMLTGKPVYEGDSVVTIMFKHVHGDVPDRSAFGPEVPKDLADAVIRMLAKDPADRWPTMEDALPALRGVTATQDTKVRSEMAALAADGTHQELLARVSTPLSPTPIALDAAETKHLSTGLRQPEVPRTGRGLVIAVSAVVVVGAVLGLWRPWATGARTRGGVDSVTAAVTPPPRAPDTLAQAAPASQPPADAPAPPPSQAATTESAPPASASSRPAPPPAVRAVRFVAPPTTLAEGDSAELAVELLDQQGRVVQRPLTWASADTQVAVIRPAGTVVALAPGRATISAAAEGREAHFDLVVTPVVASLAISPAADTLAPAASLTLAAVARRRDGSTLAGAAVTWRSSDETVAVVSSAGRVTALGPGVATITALAGGQTGAARITVVVPAPVVAAKPPPAQPPAEDAEAAIRGVIAAYAQALQAKDVARARVLYPAMSSDQERSTRQALQAMHDLQVRLAATSITVEGARAHARVAGEWIYDGGKKLPVSSDYRFERRASGWVIVGID